MAVVRACVRACVPVLKRNACVPSRWHPFLPHSTPPSTATRPTPCPGAATLNEPVKMPHPFRMLVDGEEAEGVPATMHQEELSPRIRTPPNHRFHPLHPVLLRPLPVVLLKLLLDWPAAAAAQEE